MWEDLGNLLCDMGVIPTPSTNRDPQGAYIFQASRDLRTFYAGQHATKTRQYNRTVVIPNKTYANVTRVL